MRERRDDGIIWAMKNITTYYARNNSVLVWLVVLLMTVSAVTRVAYFASVGVGSAYVMVVRILLPIAANLILAIRLPWHGEKQFYVTIGPVFLFTVYFISAACRYDLMPVMTITCIILCVLQYAIYSFTYKGRIGVQIPAFVIYAIFLLAVCDPSFRYYFTWIWSLEQNLVVSDLAIWLGIILTILASKRMEPWKEGDPYRLRYGDRADGRLIRNNSPMNKLNPYFMPTRNGASNFIMDKVEITNMERYIRQKRRDGLKHFGITHVILASYVRACAELPGVNRFLAGQKIYARFGIIVSMCIKKEMAVNEPETVIKIKFDPSDNADEVYRKYDEALQAVRTPELDSGFDKATKYIDYIPGLLKKFVVWLMKTLDYFGLLPMALMDLSPFHGSMFITSMGSLGIPPIFHHLYDFGNIPTFCAFGCKRTENELNSDGEVESHKYIDFTWVTDERIIDGFYYASVLKKMRSLMLHPEKLDEPIVPVEDIY